MEYESLTKTKDANNVRTNDFKEDIQIEEKIAIENIINELKMQQGNIENDSSPWKNLIFNWINIEGEKVNLLSKNRIYEWLYPINFCQISALIIEILNWNVEEILDDRETMMKKIPYKMRMSEKSFIRELKKVQKTLIIKNKVKICENGKIIPMNLTWEERERRIEVQNG